MNNKLYRHVAPYTIETIEQNLDKPQTEYVTIQYLYCGICGGDYSVYIGRRNEYPVSLGHEFVGKIIDIGNDVTCFKIGDYVISDYNYRCGECINCLSGKTHLCLYNNRQAFSNRAFAQYGNVHNNYLHLIPKFDFMPKACLIEPLSCVIHACELCKLSPEMNIIINGCGSIGMLFVFYLTHILSFKNVYINEKNEKRKKNILDFFPVNAYVTDKNISSDYIIECSNSLEGLQYALDICDLGEHICIMSHIYGLNTSFVYENICKKELIPLFPLRNGNINIIESAIKYITFFWDDSYNQMLGIFDDIHIAFAQKDITPYNKQIIKLCN